jgi:drug/metabolite transporter (DMT)-like permease
MIAAYQLPIATVTAIHFVSPIMITLLAIPVLGERVGLHRWAAVGLGFVGVLVIIRPATSGFDVWTLLPLVSATGWAASVILTKVIGGRDELLTSLIYSSLVASVLQGLPIATFVLPTPGEAGLAIIIGLLTVVGQFSINYAFTVVEASLLAPFSYVQLIWASLLGFLVFGVWPDALTLTGMGMLIASAVYTAYRERAHQPEHWHQAPLLLQNPVEAES